MATQATAAPALTPVWMRVINGQRTMPHYKPAALIVLLEMTEAGEVNDRFVPLATFLPRFQELLSTFDPKGSKQGYQPFLHLVTDGLWELRPHGGNTALGHAAMARSSTAFAKHVEGAVIAQELLDFVATAPGRAAVRSAVVQLLAADGAIKAQALLAKIAPEAEPIAQTLIDLHIGETYERAAIHARFGGQDQGGICTPANSKFIILFTGDAGKTYGYKDEWRDGVFVYSGEGQTGDMQFVRGNRAIRDHARDGKELLLFESLGNGKPRQYTGMFNYAGHEITRGPDQDGNDREVIRFHLVPVDTAQMPEPEIDSELGQLDLAALKQKAYEAANDGAAAADGSTRRNYYKRSATVKAYVLARANGVCEACKEAAPFKRVDGTPYLEPHHVRRLSDGGPDHPRYVGAICPTCHRRIHHGADGAEWNSGLAMSLLTLEVNVLEAGHEQVVSDR